MNDTYSINWSLLIKFLNVFGIILVVLGHSGSTESFISSSWFGYVIAWIYSFHMPLFFFVSGFLFNYTYESFINRSFVYSIKKKAVRLLVPYFVLGFIVWGIKFAMQKFLSSSLIEFSFKQFFLMFISPQSSISPLGYLWFVFTLFEIFLIIFVVLYRNKKLGLNYLFWIGIIIVFLFISLFTKNIDLFNIKAVSYYIMFFSIGALFSLGKEKLLSFFCLLKNKFVLLFLFCLSVFNIAFNLIGGGLFCKFFSAIIGILFALSLGLFLCGKGNKVDYFVLKFASYTYSIYLLHWFGQYIVKIPYVNLLHIENLFLVPLMFLGGCIFPLLVCKFVDNRLDEKFWKNISYIIGR